MQLDAERAAILRRTSPLAFPPVVGVRDEAERVYLETWEQCARDVRENGPQAFDAVRPRAESLRRTAATADAQLARSYDLEGTEAEARAIAREGGHTPTANLAALAHRMDNGAGAFASDRVEALGWKLFRASVLDMFAEAYETWGSEAFEAPPMFAEGPPSESPEQGARPDSTGHARTLQIARAVCAILEDECGGEIERLVGDAGPWSGETRRFEDWAGETIGKSGRTAMRALDATGSRITLKQGERGSGLRETIELLICYAADHEGEGD